MIATLIKFTGEEGHTITGCDKIFLKEMKYDKNVKYINIEIFLL